MDPVHAGVYAGRESDIGGIAADSVVTASAVFLVHELPRIILPSIDINRFSLRGEWNRR